MRWNFLFAGLLFWVSAWGASTPASVMRQAVQVYQQGEYGRALKLLEGLEEAGYISGGLYFNLGNCYHQTGQLGKAILNYEKGLLLQPGNRKLQHNLRVARSEVAGNPLPWPEFSLARLWGSLRGWLSANTWTIIGLIVCWAALAAWWYGRGREKDWIWNLGVIGLAFITLVCWLLAFSATRALYSDFSIIMTEELTVQVGPDAQSGRVSTVYEGWKVKRLDQIGDWIKVELPDGQEGWVQPFDVENL